MRHALNLPYRITNSLALCFETALPRIRFKITARHASVRRCDYNSFVLQFCSLLGMTFDPLAKAVALVHYEALAHLRLAFQAILLRCRHVLSLSLARCMVCSQRKVAPLLKNQSKRFFEFDSPRRQQSEVVALVVGKQCEFGRRLHYTA